MKRKDQAWLKQIKETKVDPISVDDIESYFKKHDPARLKAKPRSPNQQDLELLHEAYDDITPSAARRYLALNEPGFSAEYSGELAVIQNQKIEAIFLKQAKGDPILADEFLKLYLGTYGNLGEAFMLRPALHWFGFIFVIILMVSAFAWAFLDLVLGLNQLEWWQRLIFLIVPPIGFFYVIREHRGAMKLAAYAKSINE